MACSSASLYYLFYTDNLHVSHYIADYTLLLTYSSNIIIVGFTANGINLYVSIKDSSGLSYNGAKYYNYILQYQIEYTGSLTGIPVRLLGPVYTYIGYKFSSTQNYKFGVLGSLTSCAPDNSIYAYFTDNGTGKVSILKINPIQSYVKTSVSIYYSGTDVLAIEGQDYINIKSTSQYYNDCICILGSNNNYDYDIEFSNTSSLKYYSIGGGGGGGLGYGKSTNNSTFTVYGGSGGGGGGIMLGEFELEADNRINVSIGKGGVGSTGISINAMDGGSTIISGSGIGTITALGGGAGPNGSLTEGIGGVGGIGDYTGGAGAKGNSDKTLYSGNKGFTIEETSPSINLSGGGGGGGGAAVVYTPDGAWSITTGTVANGGNGGIGGGGGGGAAVNNYSSGSSVLSSKGGIGGIGYDDDIYTINGLNGGAYANNCSGIQGSGSLGGGSGGGGAAISKAQGVTNTKGGNGAFVIFF